VTVVGHDLPANTATNLNSTVTVKYHNANEEQIRALTLTSTYCYQSFYHTCSNTLVGQ